MLTPVAEISVANRPAGARDEVSVLKKSETYM